jgi:hypothetical protein
VLYGFCQGRSAHSFLFEVRKNGFFCELNMVAKDHIYALKDAGMGGGLLGYYGPFGNIEVLIKVIKRICSGGSV